MKKTNDVKANLESGMYFKFKENGRYSIHRNKVYSLSIKDSGMALRSYYTTSDGGYMFDSSVLIRRLGETSMDYFDFDMFGKKTRGRIYYKEIDSFFYAKDNKTKIEKALVAKEEYIDYGSIKKLV
jgi:hypothetical protein